MDGVGPSVYNLQKHFLTSYGYTSLQCLQLGSVPSQLAVE